jgi:uncharacterized MnhB-related membrane protein
MILFDLIIFEYILLLFLVGCALAVSFTRKVLSAVIIFMSYSIVMSIIWVLLEAPDLALTEAAIGAGITSILFFLAIKRINIMERQRGGGDRWKTEDKKEKEQPSKDS